MKKRGHEIAGHSYDESRYFIILDPEEEKGDIKKTISAIEKAIQKRPIGWMSQSARCTERTAELLVQNGEILDGVRLVSRKPIEHMTSNHVPPGYKSASPMQMQIMWPSPSLETGHGFGLGFGINCEPE